MCYFELIMTEEKENGQRTTIKVEVYLEKNGGYFIDVLTQNHPWVIGSFLTLDEALRYTYFELDNPSGSVEVVGVSEGEISFSFEPSEPTESKLKNVIPLRRKRGKDK